LRETSGVYSDSTTFGNAGTGFGTITRGVSGMADGSITKASGANYIQIANESQFDFERTDTFTFAAWVKITSPGANNFVLCKELNSGTYAGPYLCVGTDNKVGMLLENNNNNYTAVAGTRTVADSAWHYLVGVNLAAASPAGQAADIRLYVDVILETLVTNRNDLGTLSILNNTPVTIGSRESGGVPLTGSMDETRISSVARSANWIWAEYMNMASNALFNSCTVVAPGVTIAESGGNTIMTEGGTDSYTISLNTQPTSTVTVTVSTDGQVTANPTQVVFTTTTWSQPQTIVLTALDDMTVGNTRTSMVTHAVVSADTNYNGRAVSDVNAVVVDNDAFNNHLYAMKIAFTGYTKSETLTNFPALVVLTNNVGGFAYSQLATNSGADLRFASSDLTAELPYERETWTTNANSYLWVRVPELATTGTWIWAIWGNSSATSAPAYWTNGAVWANGYGGVWHLLSGSSLTDSTANANNGAPTGTTVTNGYVASARYFNGSSDYVGIPSASSLGIGSGGSISCWATLPNWGTTTDNLLIGNDRGFPTADALYMSQHNTVGLHIRYGSTSQAGNTYLSYAGSRSWPANSWHYLTAVWTNNGTLTELGLYADGQRVAAGTTTLKIMVTASAWDFGKQLAASPNQYWLNGTMDEARLSRSARSADWIWAEYMNTASNGVFQTATSQTTPAAVVCSTTQVAVTEGGASTNFTLALVRRPSNTVTAMLFTASDRVTLSPSNLTFTIYNWTNAQSVTVSAVNDSIAEGLHLDIITGYLASADAMYNGLTTAVVTATITDNDTAGVILSATNLSVSETGPTAQAYSIVLLSQPTDSVTVTVSGATADVTLSTNLVVFTAGNWSTPTSITVTAVDDAIAEQTPEILVLTNTVTSPDPVYNGMTVSNVTVSLTDNDAAGILVTPLSIAVDENPSTSTNSFTVQLLSQPTADVTVSYSYNGGQIDVVSNLTISPLNWAVAYTVTVTAVNDLYDETAIMNESLYVNLTSTDAAYHGMQSTVAVAIADNDITVTIAATTPVGTELGPFNAEFGMNLSKTAPEGGLTIYFDILGTASNSLDYSLIADYVNVNQGASSKSLPIEVIKDKVAETNETVQLVIKPNAAYVVGSPNNATVTIQAIPYDLWKVGHFGLANANSTNAADGADWDGDGRKNLMEYILNSDPKVVNSNVEFQVQVETTSTGKWFTVYYTRREPLYDAAVGVDVTTNLIDAAAWSGTNALPETVLTVTNGVADIKARVTTPAFTNTPALNVRLKATDL
jgi:hypothetical protein